MTPEEPTAALPFETTVEIDYMGFARFGDDDELFDVQHYADLKVAPHPRRFGSVLVRLSAIVPDEGGGSYVAALCWTAGAADVRALSAQLTATADALEGQS